MAENKTVPTDADVRGFLAAVEHPVRRAGDLSLRDLMGRIKAMRPPSNSHRERRAWLSMA